MSRRPPRPPRTPAAPRLALLLLLALASGCAPLLRAGPARGATGRLAASLDSLFADSALAHAHWGVLVRSLESGQTLYQRQPERLFVPASNMKLVTGMAALEALGPEYRYRTQLLAAGPVRGGVLQGDLLVVGGGDPTISARFGTDARATFRAWADSLRARGIQRVRGGILGVDSVFDDVPLGRGWAWDDLEAAYSAEIGGLQFNEGALELRLYPGRAAGDPGQLVLDPPTAYPPLVNRTRTVARGRQPWLRVEREAAGPGVVATGEAPLDTVGAIERIALRNPTGYFVTVLRETLREAGIVVEGLALDADEEPDRLPAPGRATPLFTHHSPPLAEILPAYMKPSQNQIAETLLRTLGRERRGAGTADAGAAAADSVLRARGVATAKRLVIADGSGLSRYNLVSPALFVELLTAMTRSPHWNAWYASLPVAGRDGTLAGRMRGTPAEANLRAKTGTLSGVRSLSGYVTSASGERLVFSVLVNHHALSARDVDRVVDQAMARLAGWR